MKEEASRHVAHLQRWHDLKAIASSHFKFESGYFFDKQILLVAHLSFTQKMEQR
jgi:hypothetical protein